MIRELKERQEHTDRMIKELKEAQEEKDRMIRELRKSHEQTEMEIERFSREIGLKLIQPAVKPPKRRINGKDFEIDWLAVGKDFVIIIETKTKPNRKAITQLEKNIDRFQKFYPEYRGYRIYGAIAGIINLEEIKNTAEKMGFFVIKHKDGKDVKILNSKKFKPKDYSKIRGNPKNKKM